MAQNRERKGEHDERIRREIMEVYSGCHDKGKKGRSTLIVLEAMSEDQTGSVVEEQKGGEVEEEPRSNDRG